ncbi:HCLS1-associated protein X-1 [Limanda limanda]|uniref:HCLS1-associated protein X-1 n=1 Tax=Limanda limanda TaxID=27771 RepID=UPI0029C92AFF|nr:HCLS1-associated protein X-1 [Limanda limanda]
MSVFDLFRGFFSVPGSHHRGRRDPFFDAMTHDDDDDDYDDEEEDGFFHDADRGGQQDPFDSALRFGFSLGPDGMRIQEPPLFGHVLREMEEIFSQLGHWDSALESGHFGVPNITPPPSSQDRLEDGGGGSSGNPLRDFMLKTPDGDTRGPQPGAQREPRQDGRPFSKFYDIWKQGIEKQPAEGHREDRDLDSAVSAGGLDKILTPPAGQAQSRPRIQSFFQSVSISKVVKPDGTVEERRTVSDGKGNEETTVTRSGGPGVLERPGDRPGPGLPGGQRPFSDLRDDDSLFSQLFGGFK